MHSIARQKLKTNLDEHETDNWTRRCRETLRKTRELLYKIVQLQCSSRGESLHPYNDSTKILNAQCHTLPNKKTYSTRHSRHTRPGICIFWSLFKVNRTICGGVRMAKTDFGIFASLTLTFDLSRSKM